MVSRKKGHYAQKLPKKMNDKHKENSPDKISGE